MRVRLVNDANDWAIETMHNPRYPLELFQRVVTANLEAQKFVAGPAGAGYSRGRLRLPAHRITPPDPAATGYSRMARTASSASCTTWAGAFSKRLNALALASTVRVWSQRMMP